MKRIKISSTETIQKRSFLIYKKIFTTNIILLLLITTTFAGGLTNTSQETTITTQLLSQESKTLTFTYEFSSIEPVQTEDGLIISIDGLDHHYNAGAPILPQQTVKILIPKDHDVDSIKVKPGAELLLPMQYDIAPAQKVVPLSYDGLITLVERNSSIYESSDPYPGTFYEIVSLQHSHGFKALILNLFPLQYKPTLQELIYYPNMKLEVSTILTIQSNREIRGSRMLPGDLELLLDIKNPDVLSTYTKDGGSPLGGREVEVEKQIIDPTEETFTYVIVTNEALRDAQGDYTFQDLIQSKLDKGLSATIVTVEEIEACHDYWWNGDFGDGEPLYNDTQCHIRNFIKDAYENWETEYILLGGDGDGEDVGGESGDNIIPVRIIDEGSSDPIPSDLYYSCLDGSYDSDGDGLFGEPGDGYDIDPETGEVDLFAEVYIGRAPIDSSEELSNFVMKTLAYENSDGEEYLRDVWMVGEYLGLGGVADYGAFYKEEIRTGSSNHGYSTDGIPDLYNVSTLYDLDWEEPGWPKSEILSIINDSVHFINHLGHGNNFKIMKLYEPVRPLDENTFVECHDITENLTNDQYFFGYSQACFSGSFDNKWPEQWGGQYLEYDCITEHLVGAEHGAFAMIANTRYGLGMVGSTDGPSQNYDREFFDALFGENIRQLGAVNQDAKEDNIGKLGNLGMRYCYFEITLFGDPELSIKDPPLRDHDVKVAAIDAPDYFWYNSSVDINTTISNQGLNDEIEVLVNFSIDGNPINSTIIPVLQSQESVDLSVHWSHEIPGIYEITIAVEPVPGEEYLVNNMRNTSIIVVDQKPLKACVLDGFAADFMGYKYDIINEQWPDYGNIPITVDWYTLNKADITYEDIAATEADLLIIDSSFLHEIFNWEFTWNEINAIIQYISEGHGLLMMFITFGGNNDLLLPLVGLTTGPSSLEDHSVQSYEDETHILYDTLPLFNNMLNPCTIPGLIAIPPDNEWNENELDQAIYTAITTRDEQEIGAMTFNRNHAVYISQLLDEIAEDHTSKQLLYNAIVFSSKPARGVWTYTLRSSYQGIVGQPLQFQSWTGGGQPPYTWHWDFGDGNISDEQNPIHYYYQHGNFTVNLTVTDAQDMIATDTTQAIIAKPDPLTINVSGHDGVVGQEIYFESQVNGGAPPYTWHWEFGDGNVSSLEDPIHIYQQPVEYNVSLTVIDYFNEMAEANTTVTIEIPGALDVDIHGPYNGVIFKPIQFYSDVLGGVPPYSWLWEFGDNTNSSLQNPRHIYNTTGQHNITLTITDFVQNISINTTFANISDSSTEGEGWPMFRQNPAHTAFVDELGPDENDVLWSTNLGCFFNSPSVANGVAYVGSYYDDGKLHAVNATTGEELWNYSTNRIVRGAPTICEDVVYIGANYGSKLFAIYTNGTRKWELILHGGVSTSPLVVNDIVYIGTESLPNTKIYAVDAQHGHELWNFSTNGTVDSTPAYAKGIIYVGSYDDRIYALNAINGSKIWEYDTGGSVGSSPAVDNGVVYVGVGYPEKKVLALDALNGSKIWEYDTGGSVGSSPAVAHGMVYIGSGDNNIYALDALNGTKIWNYTTDDSVRSSPAVSRTMVYVGSDRTLYALNAFTGEKIWSYHNSGHRSSPALYEGRLYVVFLRSLYAFEPDYTNAAPDVPLEPSGPVKVYAGYMVNYSTTTTDPDGDHVYYQWHWGGDGDSEWFGPFESGEEVSMAHSFSTTGNHWIKVKAKDTHNEESGESDSLLVYVVQPGDTDYDGDVDTTDLLILLGSWGDEGGPADINYDGIVNVEDLLILLGNWTG